VLTFVILLKLPESPMLRMEMNGSPERSEGTSSRFLGFKEAPPKGGELHFLLLTIFKRAFLNTPVFFVWLSVSHMQINRKNISIIQQFHLACALSSGMIPHASGPTQSQIF
jgi:hypothetical protein